MKSQLHLMDDQLKNKAMESQSHLQIENELRNKNEQLLGQSRQVEFLNKQKDEEIAALKRHLEKSNADIKSLSWLESQLKMEVSGLKQNRIDSEDQVQQMKQQLSSFQMFQRQKDMEIQ